MIGYNYKSELVFYNYTQEVDKQLKNGKIRVKVQKFGGPMTQKRYAQEILLIVKRRKDEVERRNSHFIFQEDNDGSHGTRSEENIARFTKC